MHYLRTASQVFKKQAILGWMGCHCVPPLHRWSSISIASQWNNVRHTHYDVSPSFIVLLVARSCLCSFPHIFLCCRFCLSEEQSGSQSSAGRAAELQSDDNNDWAAASAHGHIIFLKTESFFDFRFYALPSTMPKSFSALKMQMYIHQLCASGNRQRVAHQTCNNNNNSNAREPHAHRILSDIHFSQDYQTDADEIATQEHLLQQPFHNPWEKQQKQLEKNINSNISHSEWSRSQSQWLKCCYWMHFSGALPK